jgi:hypothetical protein
VIGLVFRKQHLGRSAPDHDAPGRTLCLQEGHDVGSDGLDPLAVGALGARVRPAHLGHVGRVEDGGERPNRPQERADPLDGRLVEDPSPTGGGEGVVWKRVPGAEVELVEGGEGYQVADARDPLLVPAAQAHRPELGERPDRLTRAGPDRLDSGDQGRPDGAQAHAEHGEMPLGRRDLRWAREGRLRTVLA